MLSLELPTWGSQISGFAAVVTPNGASAYYSGTGAGAVVTGSVTCNPMGGTPPYTYSWINGIGDPEILATNNNSQSTTFYAAPPPSTFSYVAYYYCQVTDSTMATANSNLIPVEIDRNT